MRHRHPCPAHAGLQEKCLARGGGEHQAGQAEAGLAAATPKRGWACSPEQPWLAGSCTRSSRHLSSALLAFIRQQERKLRLLTGSRMFSLFSCIPNPRRPAGCQTAESLCQTGGPSAGRSSAQKPQLLLWFSPGSGRPLPCWAAVADAPWCPPSPSWEPCMEERWSASCSPSPRKPPPPHDRLAY